MAWTQDPELGNGSYSLLFPGYLYLKVIPSERTLGERQVHRHYAHEFCVHSENHFLLSFGFSHFTHQMWGWTNGIPTLGCSGQSVIFVMLQGSTKTFSSEVLKMPAVQAGLHF